MNTRELLSKAINSVINQGRQSITNSGCAYRGPDGVKCAIGHLISDEFYNPRIEGDGIQTYGSSVREMVEESIGRELTEDEFMYLTALQNAHDRASQTGFVDEFCLRIRRGIKYKELPKYCEEIIKEAGQ